MVVGCTSDPDGSPPGQVSPSDGSAAPGDGSATVDVTTVDVTTVASRWSAPWSIAFEGTTALISERDSAQIFELSATGRRRVVGTVERATPTGEGGLLGIAADAGFLYAYFTAGDENRVERFELTGRPGSLGLGTPTTILDGIAAAGYHNGGRIAFGPDGMLYVTVGDAGDPAAAQDHRSLSGKILRLTPDGDVPNDNPFDGSPVYSVGHRNPQGLAWDDDGTLYASEFGQNTWDELNVIEPGRNYGWPTVEGIAHDDRFTDPVQQWEPSNASPSGMTIAAGSIWIANLRGERLREIPLTDLTASRGHLVGQYGRLRDVVLAPDGSLWVLTNNTDGRGDPRPNDDRILRLVP
ncbi:PQQ-dependent sugar dehydrogenase [Gordonia hydrophobica]